MIHRTRRGRIVITIRILVLLLFWLSSHLTVAFHNPKNPTPNSSSPAIANGSSAMSHSSGRRIVLVTGGNKGIGRAVCERLLSEWTDTSVILGSRDVERGRAAAADIVAQTGCDPSRVSCLCIDTASDESVRTAALQLQDTLKNGQTEEKGEPVLLYGIVNNAGIGWGYSVSDTINTNYFGPRRVNTEFGPLLMRPGGRIVNVGSAAGPNFLQSINDEALKTKLYQPWTLGGGIQELDDLARSPWSSSNGYGISKALLNAYTVLHGREAQPGVIVNSVSPGYIETDLTKGRGATNPPSKGAVPICKLLMDEAFADPKLHPPGRYYGSDAVRSPLHYYRDPGEAPYENDEDLLYTGATT